MLYYPERLPRELPPPRWAGPCEETWLTCEDGVPIHALWWPEPAGAPALLFLHGNAQEAYSWSLVRGELQPLGCRMLLPDYRGYGKSGGEPTEEGLYRDGRAALKRLADLGLQDREVVVFGKSLGGAVACEIARGRDLRALILESTFSSLAAVAHHLFPGLPAGTELPESYASIDKVAELRCPVLVIHGDRDELIPLEEGLALYEAAPQPKRLWVVEGAGHNDVSLVAGQAYAERIAAFLREHAP